MVKPLKIVYCAPALYLEGGVERVLTLKANYFAEHYGYEITIILTDGKDKPNAFPLSDKITVINLDINFEELWYCSFVKKVFLYLIKQRKYKKKLSAELMRIKPDITDSLLRREINFLTKINDGSKKIGELHVSKNNFRTFKDNETNYIKKVFSKYWISMTIPSLKRLDKFVVLTNEDKMAWTELSNVIAIPNPISFATDRISSLSSKNVLVVGRYDYVKGFDMLLKAWKRVETVCQDWHLNIYGAGNRSPYEDLAKELGIDMSRCHLNGPTSNIKEAYLDSSLFVLSSRFEGLSMSLLEAISCGLPVVAFECPCGPKDVFENGVNGILVPRENIELLANNMISVMQSSELAKKLGNNARIRSCDFKIDVIAERWRELFESM